MVTGLTTDWDFWEPAGTPQILRGFGMMLAIRTDHQLALGTLPVERLKNASGLFNLTRNMGGAVGLAGLNTVLDDRMDLHFARLHDAITWSRLPAVEALNGLAARIPGSDAQNMALKQLFMLVHQQGVVMAFADVFLIAQHLVRGVRRLRRAVTASRAGGGGRWRTLTRSLMHSVTIDPGFEAAASRQIPRSTRLQ